MTTLPELLDRRLRADPAKPLITFYDDATGERTELSVLTFANWVAKTANLFTEELMLDPGEEVAIRTGTHWLTPVFVAAAWSCGLQIVADAPARVVGPDEAADEAGPGPVLACSLTPFATPLPRPPAPGVLDHGTLWAAQSDVFVPVEPATVEVPEPSGERVITDLDPAGARGRELLAALLAGGGSLVLVAHPDEGRWPAHSQGERATVTMRTDQPIR